MNNAKKVIQKMYFFYMRAGIGVIATKSGGFYAVQATKTRRIQETSYIVVTERGEEVEILIKDIKEVFPAGISKPEMFWAKHLL